MPRSVDTLNSVGKDCKTSVDQEAVAMVVFNPLIEGAKKYSPPRGMMKSGIAKSVCSFCGSSPDIERTPWPMSGSNLDSDPGQYPAHAYTTNRGTHPGFSGCVSNDWKSALFAQPLNRMQIRSCGNSRTCRSTHCAGGTGTR